MVIDKDAAGTTGLGNELREDKVPGLGEAGIVGRLSQAFVD